LGVSEEEKNEHDERIKQMKFKMAFLISLSLGLLSTGETQATRYAKAWWGQSDAFTPECDQWDASHDQDMILGPQYWLVEVTLDANWDYVTFGNVTYAEFALSDDYVTRGRDHYTTGNKGFDYADAVYVDLHGAHTWHDDKKAWGFICSDTYGRTGFQNCGAWMDQMDFGDDNGDRDIEWLHLSSCRSVWKYHVTSSYSDDYHQWSHAFDGLHSITGFEGIADAPYYPDCADFAEDAFDNIKDAWLTHMINWTFNLPCTDQGRPFTAHRACPAWITYDETTEECQYTMNYDDYTTPVLVEPPEHGGNNIRLRARWTNCVPC
jgi:hypothetical protein